MNPYQQFVNGLRHVRAEFNENLEEMLVFAEVMARKANSIDRDENGLYYVTSCGNIDEIIPIMEQQIEKLKRLQKDNPIDR